MSEVRPRGSAWTTGMFVHLDVDRNDLDPYEYRVYGHLCSRANEEVRTWVRQSVISAICGIHPRQVIRVLKSLEDKGWIRREERRREDGSRASDNIIIMGPPGQARRYEPSAEELASVRAKAGKTKPKQGDCQSPPGDLPSQTAIRVTDSHHPPDCQSPPPRLSVTPCSKTNELKPREVPIAADAARPSAGVDPKIRLPGETLQEHMDRIRAKVRERASVPPAPPAAPAPAPDPAPAARKPGKKPKASPKPEPKERARNPMFDAVAPHVAGSSDPMAIKADAGQIARVAKYLGDLGITPEQVPLLAEYIQVNCYVTRQPTILAGSWEKFTGRWISAGKGGAKTLADRLMERYEQPPVEVAPEPDDDFEYDQGAIFP